MFDLYDLYGLDDIYDLNDLYNLRGLYDLYDDLVYIVMCPRCGRVVKPHFLACRFLGRNTWV